MVKYIQAHNYRAAQKQAPWAAVIARCSGGYMCFEFISDHKIWRKQS
jgi:hypothetical protein